MWILQNNIWKEEKYNQIFEYLDRYGIEYRVISLIPFSDSIELPCPPDQVEMVFGSIKFTELAEKQGVKIHAKQDIFNYLEWVNRFEENCLNWDSKVELLGRLEFPFEHDVFIRPVLDDKSFSGTVLRAGDTLSQIQFTTSKPIENIFVQVAPIKEIYSEDRFFVVDGKVVTGSCYKIGHRVVYGNLDGKNLGSEMFAQKMVNIWSPSDMFVIDIATCSDNQFKIIEFGSIHNCGFYDIDLSKLIQAIQEYNLSKLQV